MPKCKAIALDTASARMLCGRALVTRWWVYAAQRHILIAFERVCAGTWRKTCENSSTISPTVPLPSGHVPTFALQPTTLWRRVPEASIGCTLQPRCPIVVGWLPLSPKKQNTNIADAERAPLATQATTSEWSRDTGGERDENGAPIRALDGIWKELFTQARRLHRRPEETDQHVVSIFFGSWYIMLTSVIGCAVNNILCPRERRNMWY